MFLNEINAKSDLGYKSIKDFYASKKGIKSFSIDINTIDDDFNFSDYKKETTRLEHMFSSLDRYLYPEEFKNSFKANDSFLVGGKDYYLQFVSEDLTRIDSNGDPIYDEDEDPSVPNYYTICIIRHAHSDKICFFNLEDTNSKLKMCSEDDFQYQHQVDENSPRNSSPLEEATGTFGLCHFSCTLEQASDNCKVSQSDLHDNFETCLNKWKKDIAEAVRIIQIEETEDKVPAKKLDLMMEFGMKTAHDQFQEYAWNLNELEMIINHLDRFKSIGMFRRGFGAGDTKVALEFAYYDYTPADDDTNVEDIYLGVYTLTGDMVLCSVLNNDCSRANLVSSEEFAKITWRPGSDEKDFPLIANNSGTKKRKSYSKNAVTCNMIPLKFGLTIEELHEVFLTNLARWEQDIIAMKKMDIKEYKQAKDYMYAKKIFSKLEGIDDDLVFSELVNKSKTLPAVNFAENKIDYSIAMNVISVDNKFIMNQKLDNEGLDIKDIGSGIFNGHKFYAGQFSDSFVIIKIPLFNNVNFADLMHFDRIYAETAAFFKNRFFNDDKNEYNLILINFIIKGPIKDKIGSLANLKITSFVGDETQDDNKLTHELPKHTNNCEYYVSNDENFLNIAIFRQAENEIRFKYQNMSEEENDPIDWNFNAEEEVTEEIVECDWNLYEQDSENPKDLRTFKHKDVAVNVISIDKDIMSAIPFKERAFDITIKDGLNVKDVHSAMYNGDTILNCASVNNHIIIKVPISNKNDYAMLKYVDQNIYKMCQNITKQLQPGTRKKKVIICFIVQGIPDPSLYLEHIKVNKRVSSSNKVVGSDSRKAEKVQVMKISYSSSVRVWQSEASVSSGVPTLYTPYSLDISYWKGRRCLNKYLCDMKISSYEHILNIRQERS